MAKKTSKAAREAQEKSALRKRLKDLAQGAIGGYASDFLDNEEEATGLASEMGLETFARWVGAIERALCGEQKFLVELHNLHHFETLSSATDFLYEYSIRA